MPFGAVPAGIAASAIGVEPVVAAGGVMLVVFVIAAYLVFPQFRTLDRAISAQRADQDAAYGASRRPVAPPSYPAQAAGR